MVDIAKIRDFNRRCRPYVKWAKKLNRPFTGAEFCSVFDNGVIALIDLTDQEGAFQYVGTNEHGHDLYHLTVKGLSIP